MSDINPTKLDTWIMGDPYPDDQETCPECGSHDWFEIDFNYPIGKYSCVECSHSWEMRLSGRRWVPNLEPRLRHEDPEDTE